MKKVVEKRKDIVFYVKLYPLIKPDSEQYQSIVCGKYSKMLNTPEFNIKKKTGRKENTDCNIKKIENDLKFANSIGVSGTPTLVMPGGKMYSGKMPADVLIELIDGK
jgi:thiol:disulfide interchange protein DsbC